MAAFVVAVVLVTLLTSLRMPGWRMSAWSAGVGGVIVGLASLALPEVTGSLGVLGGLLLSGWCVSVIGAAELDTRRQAGAGQS
ncbi:MAG: hypothetical protein WEE50_07490 [Chloroflexota bacterium]